MYDAITQALLRVDDLSRRIRDIEVMIALPAGTKFGLATRDLEGRLVQLGENAARQILQTELNRLTGNLTALQTKLAQAEVVLA